MRKTTRITLAITVICMALAGCGSASEPSTPAHAVRSIDSQCSDMDDEFSECVITLTDTRKVDCKVLIDMIVKWHQAGYSLDEIAPLMPQVPKEEIKAIIQHTRE